MAKSPFSKNALLPGVGVALACLMGRALIVPPEARAQMVNGAKVVGEAPAFGLGPGQTTKDYETIQVGGSALGNVLWPGETASLTLRFLNKTGAAIKAGGKVEVFRYGTSVSPGDVWRPVAYQISALEPLPIQVELAPKGFAEVTLRPKIPEAFGGYVLVADLQGHGRCFAAALVRTVAAEPGKVWLPAGSLDMPPAGEMNEQSLGLYQRIGIKGARMEVSYFPTTAPDFDKRLQELADRLRLLQDHDLTIMLTIGAGPAPQPLGRGRPWLDEDGTMKVGVKEDLVWLPEYDPDFQKWCRIVASRFGWPKGPVNAVELWNEPWEGVSISGWGADMIRYRDLYTRMAQGVQQARTEAGVKVLIGGTCSSSNTLDKLFPDGSDRFLKWLDFCSIHYQPMAAVPSLIPAWRDRRSAYGRVQVWDTESWVANSEDRIAAVVASMRSQGQDRTNGVYRGNVYQNYTRTIDKQKVHATQAFAPAAGLAAAQKFIGQRPFQELLFKNGLPWIFVFAGLPRGEDAPQAANPDDGTVVIVGDLGGVYERDKLRFRSVLGLKNRDRVREVRSRLAALPAEAPAKARKALEAELAKVQILEGATLSLGDGGGLFSLYDFYGNPLPSRAGTITVPLNGLGYFLRTNGSPGSMQKLRQALAGARIEGYEPIEIVAHDLTAPVTSRPALRLTLTNVLNRPVTGRLRVTLGKLKLADDRQAVTLAAHETKGVALQINDGQPVPDNTYPLVAAFDAGPDGRAEHLEDLHVNVIARRTIRVDGDLEDWKGVLPQPLAGEGLRASLTEKAWLPFQQFDGGVGKGLAIGYLACDDGHFYFAAKIADDSPYEGNVRFETRDDDAYFYPAKCWEPLLDPRTRAVRGKRELTWPDGVRRYSYRKRPDLPSGMGTDNVQIAFNVLPPDRKPWLPNPPGTMPRFMAYWDTDYEYALNQVAARYGGGTEIFRLLAPGVPRKHFYPRQPGAPVDGGPVKNGALAMRRDGHTRVVELALPWSEIPEVRQRLDAGQTIKFSFRVNDNQGPAYELAAGRSVSKENFPAFHNDWATHWANELEFACEKK